MKTKDIVSLLEDKKIKELHDYYNSAFCKQFGRKAGKPRKVVVYNKPLNQKINIDELSHCDPFGSFPFVGLSTTASTSSINAEFIAISNLAGLTLIIQTGEVPDLFDPGWGELRDIIESPNCLKFGQNMTTHCTAIEKRYNLTTAGWINLEWLFWEPENSIPEAHNLREYISLVFGEDIRITQALKSAGSDYTVESASILKTACESQYALDVAALFLLNQTKTKDPIVWSQYLLPNDTDHEPFICHIERKESVLGFTERQNDSHSWTGPKEAIAANIQNFREKCWEAKRKLTEHDKYYTACDRIRFLHSNIRHLKLLESGNVSWIDEKQFLELCQEFKPVKPQFTFTTWLASAKRYCECNLTFNVPSFEKSLKAVEEGPIRISTFEKNAAAASRAIHMWCEEFSAHFRPLMNDIRNVELPLNNHELPIDVPWTILHDLKNPSTKSNEEIYESLMEFQLEHEFRISPHDLKKDFSSDDLDFDLLWVENVELEFDHRGNYECGFAPFSRVYLVEKDGKVLTESVFKVIDNYLNAILVADTVDSSALQWVPKASIIRVSTHQEDIRRRKEAEKKREFLENARKLEEKKREERNERIRALKEKRRLEEERVKEKALERDIQLTMLELLIAVDIYEDMTAAETAQALLKTGDPFTDRCLLIKLQRNDPEFKKMFEKPVRTSHGEIRVIDGLLTFVTGAGRFEKKKICVPSVLRQSLIRGFCDGVGPGKNLLDDFYWNSCRKDMDNYLDEFITGRRINPEPEKSLVNSRATSMNIAKGIVSKATNFSRKKPLVIKMREFQSDQLRRKKQQSPKVNALLPTPKISDEYYDYEDVLIPLNYQPSSDTYPASQLIKNNRHDQMSRNHFADYENSGKRRPLLKNSPEEFGLAVVYESPGLSSNSIVKKFTSNKPIPKACHNSLGKYKNISDIGSAVVYDSSGSTDNHKEHHDEQDYTPKPHSMGNFLEKLRSNAPKSRKQTHLKPSTNIIPNNVSRNLQNVQNSFQRTPLLAAPIPDDPSLEPGEVPPPQGWAECSVTRVPKRPGKPTGDWFQSHLLGGMVRQKEQIPVCDIPMPIEQSPPAKNQLDNISARKKKQMPLPYPGSSKSTRQSLITSVFATSFVPNEPEDPITSPVRLEKKKLPRNDVKTQSKSPNEMPKTFTPFAIKTKKPSDDAAVKTRSSRSDVSELQKSLGLKKKKKPEKISPKTSRKPQPFSLPIIPTPLLKAFTGKDIVKDVNAKISCPPKFPSVPVIPSTATVTENDVHHYETELSKRIKANWFKFRSQKCHLTTPRTSSIESSQPYNATSETTLACPAANIPLPPSPKVDRPAVLNEEEAFTLDNIPLPPSSQSQYSSSGFMFYESNNFYGFN